MKFSELVTSEEELRAVLGFPAPRALNKEISQLDRHCRAIISRSPFVLIASCDAEGRMDVSPKGDPPGFVKVLDDSTLAIPDRPGNRRADTFGNVLRHPRVGLLFLIPGMLETLRVNGRASIVRDFALREELVMAGRIPELALVVMVEQAFIHCAKCMMRSQLWERESWPDLAGLPSQARCLLDHAKLSESLEEVEASVQRNRRTTLY